MPDQMKGGCACGKVRFTATIHDDDAYLCHCRMCQRATGSVSIAFKSVKQAEVEWAGEPDWFDSSPIAERPFCKACGTSLGFRFKEGSDKMDLSVAAFDDPARFQPNIISAPRASTAPGSTPKACPSTRPATMTCWSRNGSRRRGKCRNSQLSGFRGPQLAQPFWSRRRNNPFMTWV